MPRTFWPTLTVLAIVQLGCSAAQPERRMASTSPSPLTASALTENPVVGSLGLPLGTVAEIEGIVFNGNETRMKAYSSSYLLRVTAVNGRPLPHPVQIEFVTGPGSSAELAGNPFALYEMKTGERPAQLNSDQVAELEKDYLGKPRRLIVFETGGFTGLPRDNSANLPYAIWQDRMWFFSTHLVVLGQRP